MTARDATAAPAGARVGGLGLLLLLAITVVWGLNWPVMKFIVGEVPVWIFRTICLVGGGLGMLAICRLAGLPLRIPTTELRPLVLVALFNVTGWNMFSGFALVVMEASSAAIICFTMPLWAALLAVPLLGERLAPTTLVGLVLGIAGLLVLLLPEWRAVLASPVGVLLTLAAAFSWAAGTVGLKYVRWSMPIAVLTGWQLLLGGLPVVAGTLLFERDFAPGTVGAAAWLAVLYVVLLPMIFGHWAWFKIVSLYPAVVAAIGTLALPVLGVLGSAWGLGERIGLPEILSLVLICLALAVVLVLPSLRLPVRRFDARNY